MGFYLLGRGREAGEMRLVSTVMYADRQSALDALSQISSEAAYAHRDAEVFVADLDQAVPVLVVASAAPAAVVSVAETDDPAAEVVTEEIVVEEPIAEAVLDDLEAAEVIEASELDVQEPPSLAESLKKAADTLESEGIVAPESVGSATASEPEAWPWEKPGAPEPELESVPDAVAVDAEDTEPEVDPKAIEPEPEPEIFEPEPALESETEPGISEPEPELAAPAYVPDPFEEPAVDAGDLLSSREDVDVSRTVVMGAYAEDEEPIPVPPVAEFDETTAVEPIEALPAEPAPEAPVLVDASESEPPALAVLELEDDDDEITGMLADLETIEQPARISAQGAQEDEQNGAALTCDDCVYVNTCPNKDEFEPVSCGNFQWKSV